MQFRRAMTLVLASTAVAALAACSSSGASRSPNSAGGSSSAGGGSAAPSAAKSAIAVGTVGSYSGFSASATAGARASIQAWADSVNASGGIDGHPIKLYIEDDGGSDATSLTDVKRLVEQDHVVAIVGQAALDAGPWADYVASKGIPVVGGNTAATTYLTNPDFYSVGGNLVSNFYGVAATAKKNGPTLGNLYCAEIPACASTVPLLKGFGAAVGVSASYSAKVSASASDFTAPCQGLKQANVTSYTLGLATATLIRVAAACAQQGVSAKLILSNVADSTFASNPAFNGTQMVDGLIPFFDTSNAATREFHADLTKYAPSIGSSKSPYNVQVTQAYVSGKLFEAAVKAGGTDSITPASIKTGLYSLKDDTLNGLTMPLTFTAGKPSPHNCYFVYGISDGKFVEPDGSTPQCAPDALIDGIISKLPS